MGYFKLPMLSNMELTIWGFRPTVHCLNWWKGES